MITSLKIRKSWLLFPLWFFGCFFTGAWCGHYLSSPRQQRLPCWKWSLCTICVFHHCNPMFHLCSNTHICFGVWVLTQPYFLIGLCNHTVPHHQTSTFHSRSVAREIMPSDFCPLMWNSPDTWGREREVENVSSARSGWLSLPLPRINLIASATLQFVCV